MPVVRWVLVACVALTVGCSAAEPTVPPTESDEPSEVAEATESPTAEPTATPSAVATETLSPQPTEQVAPVKPATALFPKRLPRRHAYAPLPRNARQQVATQLGGIENDPIISDVATRYVERGSVPVAAVIAVRFSGQATSADLNGFARGVTQGTGGRGSPTKVGGKNVTFIRGQNAAFLHVGDDFALLFFGPDRGQLEPVVAAVLSNSD